MALVVLIKSPEKLRRRDGTAIAIFDQISLVDSFKLTKDLLTDWRILILLPCRSIVPSKSTNSDRHIVQQLISAIPKIVLG